MKKRVRLLSFSLLLLTHAAAAHAQTISPLEQRVAALARAINGSGKLPLEISPGTKVVQCETTGTTLVIDIDVGHDYVLRRTVQTDLARSAKALAMPSLCRNALYAPLIKDGMSLRLAYRNPETATTFLSYVITPQECLTVSQAPDDPELIRNYLEATVRAEKKSFPLTIEFMTFFDAQVVGNSILYKIRIADADTVTFIKNKNNTASMQRILCKALNKPTPFNLDIGTRIELYDAHNMPLKTVLLSRQTCGAPAITSQSAQ
ncbi:hypothetical protein [Acetobacter cibinongensis]|uniref:Uncharacterized protein n=1 Tax=Acetobacter cibinongensis TaxID=146475 RepID=A0A1Z5YZI6_9PROT|nr:hypothetical protein [Acetobacter cibinongensis]OUJ04677.1 hypothetical protein HK14_00620 [Acetobacter cibinongensis]